MSKSTALLLATLCLAGRASAQQRLHGVVRDSATGRPVLGAVVIALDAVGGQLARTIVGADGAYHLMPQARATRIQALRIGFRPQTLDVPAGVDDAALDIRLASIPTLLEQVHVVADKAACPQRADAVAAAALYDQARAALLATVVARETNPATVTRLAFDRTLDANGVRPLSQTVRMETADRATVSFNATQDAADLARRGFARDSAGHRTFLGPDADVLLDDAFAAAYCFRLAQPNRAQPSLVGLAFTPAVRSSDRVDIDGTLWIDSLARRLHHAEFRYLNLDELSTGFNAGGTVSFREVAPDIVLIDRWTMRLVGATDSAAVRLYEVHEVGGELAAAHWADGRAWSAPLGAARIAARSASGAPAPAGTVLGLVGTDYRATVDTAGWATFANLVPGPYAVMAVDRQLADLGLTIPTGSSFVAHRDSTASLEVQVPTALEFVATLCGATGRFARDAAWLVGRVGMADGRAARGVRWRVARAGDAGWVTVADGGTTGSSGLFTLCRNLAVGQTIQVSAGRPGEAPAVAVRRLTNPLTTLPLVIAAGAPSEAAAGAPPAALTGVVLDSLTNGPVPGAFVTLVETRHTAVSDSAGVFRMAAVPRARFTAEVRTDELDAIGVVGRTAVDFRTDAPLRVFVPTPAQLVAAMCGPAAGEGAGALVGSVRLAEGSAPEQGVRLVAEWTDTTFAPRADAGRRHWVKVRAERNGSFRLCGVPAGVPVVVRTQVDSGSDVAARPQEVRIDPARRWSTLAIRLEKGLSLGASFAGTVVADSSDAPVEGAEVALPDLGLATITNAAGAFRFDSIPRGAHRVSIRRGGYVPLTAQVAFADNQTVDHRVVLGRATTALEPVTVTEAPSVNADFDANRKLGLGKFLTTEDLDRNAGRRLSDVMAIVPNFGIVTQANSGHGWVVGKRVPAHLVKTRAGTDAEGIRVSQVNGGWYSMDDLRDLGFYCPANSAEQMQGITCACYAQVWVDGRLMNRQRPTEPFDVNDYPPERLQAVEWYASASQTPAQYSSLNSPCGVLVLWTRRASPNSKSPGPGAEAP